MQGRVEGNMEGRGNEWLRGTYEKPKDSTTKCLKNKIHDKHTVLIGRNKMLMETH